MTREEAIVEAWERVLKQADNAWRRSQWNGAHVFWHANGQWYWNGRDTDGAITIARTNCVGIIDTVTEADYNEALAIAAGETV